MDVGPAADFGSSELTSDAVGGRGGCLSEDGTIALVAQGPGNSYFPGPAYVCGQPSRSHLSSIAYW